MWQSWINVFAGLWAILSGLFIVLSVPSNFLITGIIIGITGFWNAKSWQGIVNGIIGVWLFISGFSLYLSTPVNFLLSGLIVFVVAVWRLTAPTGRIQTRPTA